MKKLISILLLFLFISSAFCDDVPEKKSIIAGTEHVALIIKEISGESFDVYSPMGPAMCPGHFDLRPEDLRALSRASLVLMQGFEKWIHTARPVIGGSGIPEVTVPVEGNWMVPALQIRAAGFISEELCRLSLEKKEAFQNSLKIYQTKIHDAEKNISKTQNTPVICSVMQKPFLQWMGCRVIAVYERSENLTPKEMLGLIKKGKKEKVRLIADNLQSGPNVGKALCEEINAVHVTLTNFPLKGSYIEALKENADKILEALKQ